MEGLTAILKQVQFEMPEKKEPVVYDFDRGKRFFYNGENLTLRKHCENADVDQSNIRGYLDRGHEFGAAVKLFKERKRGLRL